MITANNVSKNFGSTKALRSLSFNIESGEVMGLLGANGAGKSTMMRLLATVLQPSSGTLFMNGVDVLANPNLVRNMVGYLPEKPPLYDDLSVGDYLHFVADMRGVDNPRSSVSKVLEQVGLIGWKNQMINVLSKDTGNVLGLLDGVHNHQCCYWMSQVWIGSFADCWNAWMPNEMATGVL